MLIMNFLLPVFVAFQLWMFIAAEKPKIQKRIGSGPASLLEEFGLGGSKVAFKQIPVHSASVSTNGQHNSEILTSATHGQPLLSAGGNGHYGLLGDSYGFGGYGSFGSQFGQYFQNPKVMEQPQYGPPNLAAIQDSPRAFQATYSNPVGANIGGHFGSNPGGSGQIVPSASSSYGGGYGGGFGFNDGQYGSANAYSGDLGTSGSFESGYSDSGYGGSGGGGSAGAGSAGAGAGNSGGWVPVIMSPKTRVNYRGSFGGNSLLSWSAGAGYGLGEQLIGASSAGGSYPGSHAGSEISTGGSYPGSHGGSEINANYGNSWLHDYGKSGFGWGWNTQGEHGVGGQLNFISGHGAQIHHGSGSSAAASDSTASAIAAPSRPGTLKFTSADKIVSASSTPVKAYDEVLKVSDGGKDMGYYNSDRKAAGSAPVPTIVKSH